MASSELPPSDGDFPLHGQAYARNNISHLSDTFSALSPKHFANSYHYCPLDSGGKAAQPGVKEAGI